MKCEAAMQLDKLCCHLNGSAGHLNSAADHLDMCSYNLLALDSVSCTIMMIMYCPEPPPHIASCWDIIDIMGSLQ